MKGLKCFIKEHVRLRSQCLLFCVLSLLVSVLSSLTFLSKDSSAVSQNLQPVAWWAYGQSEYGSSAGWSASASVGSSIQRFTVYQFQLQASNYTVNGSYVTIQYSWRWTIGNVGVFFQDRPAMMGSCQIGGKEVNITDRSDVWTTPSNISGGQAALTGYISGTVDPSASGAVVCTATGVNGRYILNRPTSTQDPLNVPITISMPSSSLTIDSYKTSEEQEDSVGQAQLEQITNVNKNLVIVNQAINNMSDNVQNSINDAADQAHKDSQAQTDAINNQAQQEQDRYDKDKQEESDRENQGKDDSDTAQGIFNFNVINPFASLFNLFTPNQCVEIPTLAGLVNSEDSTYCSWFPNSVRSIFTPVFGIASIMLLFGFVVRWLGGSNVTLFRSE